ncbi:MAG: aminopeptidase [Eubacteriales bacterium]|nr:aminopeptidase [Eubacteriales bacterium]
MKKTVMRDFAKLLALKGANVQKGQEVVIFAELDQPEFVKILVEECYRAGAKKVAVEWSYQPLEKLHIRHQKEKVLSRVEDWEIEKMKHRVDTLPAYIYLLSEDPDGLKGVNQKKMAKCSGIRRGVFKPYRDQMDNRHQWCIAAVPSKAWAKKVFPGERASVAEEKLWDAILMTSRAKGDAIKNWEEHNADLKNRYTYLNSLKISELHYTASNGTDLTVGLLPESRFMGGSDKLVTNGVEYNANIPSEECFTSPDRNRADGVVYASMPLSLQGSLVENFWMRLENGKIVEAHAERGEELLNEVLDTDEGARYLGECALVPYDSPIRNSGILFYNTLFDENAACHLAFGEGFSCCFDGFENLSLEEVHAKGINDSVVHIDFMIGTEDLNITAKTYDGKEIEIFRNGNWAF